MHIASAEILLNDYEMGATEFLCVSEDCVRGSFEIAGISDALRNGDVRSNVHLLRNKMRPPVSTPTRTI